MLPVSIVKAVVEQFVHSRIDCICKIEAFTTIQLIGNSELLLLESIPNAMVIIEEVVPLSPFIVALLL